MSPRLLVVAGLAATILTRAATPLAAQEPAGLDHGARTRDTAKSLCFWARPLATCRTFFLTEAHLRYRFTSDTAVYGQTKIYLTGELGVMRNIAPTRSIGVSVFGGYDWGVEDARLGAKGRYRWWAGSTSRFDVQAGVVWTPHKTPRGDALGALVGADYSLGDKLLVTTELDFISGEPAMPATYFGVGLGTHLGIVAYAGAAALGLLALLAVD